MQSFLQLSLQLNEEQRKFRNSLSFTQDKKEKEKKWISAKDTPSTPTQVIDTFIKEEKWKNGSKYFEEGSDTGKKSQRNKRDLPKLLSEKG